MFKIYRFYAKSNRKKLVKIVSTKEIAQLHCKDPKTCKQGIWFDGYIEVK